MYPVISKLMSNIQLLTTWVPLLADQVQERYSSATRMEHHQGHRTAALMNHVPLLVDVLMERIIKWTTLRNSTLMELKDKVSTCFILTDTIWLIRVHNNSNY